MIKKPGRKTGLFSFSPPPCGEGSGVGVPQAGDVVVGSQSMTDRQRQFARRMRAQPTDAERMLWQRLRHDITLAGSHFGPFIVDFVSRKARLVIELDGGQHSWQQAADTKRTRQIEAHGYRLLRFWNNDVLANIDGVLSEIQSALTPPPTPPRKGDGSRSRAHSSSLVRLAGTTASFPRQSTTTLTRSRTLTSALRSSPLSTRKRSVG
jgi:very-short-patch-repair endonuclease